MSVIHHDRICGFRPLIAFALSDIFKRTADSFGNNTGIIVLSIIDNHDLFQR